MGRGNGKGEDTRRRGEEMKGKKESKAKGRRKGRERSAEREKKRDGRKF